MNIKKIFDDVKTLEDWNNLSGSTKDGESSYFENKEVSIDLNTENPSNVGDFKLRIAKEMSAFANTDSGIIAIGIDRNIKVSNQTTNLEDWLDRNIRDMLEPQLSGISLKTCTDSNNKEFILMYVPKGNVIPYRTKPVKSCVRDKNNMREYFQRIGTNSVPIPMPIVRSLYLSNERSIDITAHVKPVSVHLGDDEEEPYIELGIEIKPDQSRLINEYYLEANVLLLDEDLNTISKTPIDIVPFGPNSPGRPIIPPDNKNHIIDTFRIQQEEPVDSSGSFFSPIKPSLAFGDVELVPQDIYSKIHGFYVETKFACDGLPLREDKRLLIFDSTINSDEIDVREHEMTDWSKDCLVVSWFPISEDSGLYNRIVNFMNYMGFK